MNWVEVRLLLALAVVIVAPGSSLVLITGMGAQWPRLSRLALATAASVAFYPILFTLTPFVRWGPLAIGGLLALGLILVWGRRVNLRPLLTLPDGLGWAAGLVMLLTLATRGWQAHLHPYPAWTDSLHHALLTQLTMEAGRLPVSLEPYFPIPLSMYHLGLYAVAAPVGWLAHAPPHLALLWTAQTLNALGALGVYLVLERRAGRLAALVGMAVVGLFSFQPAFYVNWGRFTQVASQTLLPAAWTMTCLALAGWADTPARRMTWLTTLVAGLLSAGVFLLHFRVAVFYLCWLAVGVVEIALRCSVRWPRLAVGLALIAGWALVLVGPVVWDVAVTYVQPRVAQGAAAAGDPGQVAVVRAAYFTFPWESFLSLGIHPWLLALTAVGALLGCVRRNGLVIGALVWVALLLALGHTYLLRISLLNVTNLGAVIILLYLPAALILGAAAAEAIKLLPVQVRQVAQRGMVVAVVVAAVAFVPVRVRDIEPARFFVTPEDLEAMAWIREHTAEDALFAVNTTFWLPKLPHGTDAGYWIPYLTGRQMTAAVMLLNLAEPEYEDRIVALSQAATAAAADPAALPALRELGVDYIYAGVWGNAAGPAFDPDRLAAQPGVEIVFRKGRAAVARLDPE
jgi:hypothetical protein